MPASLPTLPTELLYKIGGFIASSPATLRALTLTSRRFHIVYTRALYALAPLHRFSHDSSTVLHWAIQHNRARVFTLLLPLCHSTVNRIRQTPLHVALKHVHPEFTAALLALPAINVNAADSLGSTPLHVAVAAGDVDAVARLFAAGADIMRADNAERTVLHTLAYPPTPPSNALVRLLLKNGAEVRVVDKFGKTALHWACGNGHEEMVRLLLEAEAGGQKLVNHCDGRDRTPLWLAAERGYDRIVEKLLKAGAHLYGECPLLIAAGMGRVQVVKLLVGEFGVLPGAMERATENGFWEVRQVLLQYGTRVPGNSGMGYWGWHHDSMMKSGLGSVCGDKRKGEVEGQQAVRCSRRRLEQPITEWPEWPEWPAME
ncbi:ankyrin repeat-containing domain protein [Tricharina praecox]|uniref:ankyrin repeat-containing domain protein n=1 Tax=Tricharina praecox TaxID=43433 RepID=UPI0022212341|nr:ankyrin repeat-containing domain protein [Tricharina praecox]KAI5854882.1 ankyrin repeat-containing domain protein [Tricharina praecox]